MSIIQDAPSRPRELTTAEIEQKTRHLYETSVEENKEYWRKRVREQRAEHALNKLRERTTVD